MDPAVVPGRATRPSTHGVVDWWGKDTGAVQLEPITLTPDDAADGESWEEVELVDTVLAGVDARALGFTEVRFAATDLSGAKLQNLFLSECSLVRCDLSNAVVHGG